MQNNSGVIFPVGTVKDYQDKWYIASYFGEKRSNTWYHSGDDFNLKTGGNTDLNYPLVAIADGKVITTHSSNTGFGNQLVLEFLLNGKTYYALYCHLNSFEVAEGTEVKKGQIICRLGKSGTDLAHLHFSIKNTANGLTNIPNSLDELKEWENPLTFITTNYNESTENNDSNGSESDNMTADDFLKAVGVKNFTEALGVWNREMAFLEEARKKTALLEKEIEKLKKVEADYSIPSIASYGDNGLQIKKKISETETMTINYERK